MQRILQDLYRKMYWVFADANFSGGWAQSDADNAENVMSSTRYVITYTGCPGIWCTQGQTEISLSTTEVEYIALSQVMLKVIPFYGIDEGSIFYLQYTYFKYRSIFLIIWGQ